MNQRGASYDAPRFVYICLPLFLFQEGVMRVKIILLVSDKSFQKQRRAISIVFIHIETCK